MNSAKNLVPPGTASMAVHRGSQTGGLFQGGTTSLSGHERNKMFLNQAGAAFWDASGVSGADDESDSRKFAIWDYDRDGWPDLALVNANAPTLRLYHNGVATLAGRPGSVPPVIAIRFVGGNRSPKASAEWSNRDGFGAQAIVRVGARSLLRGHRCGEGWSAQNSSTVLVGLGDARVADEISVRWPSGKRTAAGAVPAGTLVTAYENLAEAPGGSGFRLEPYVPRGAVRSASRK